MKHTKIGFVGTGKRVNEMYLPVLDTLGDKAKVVGTYTRSGTQLRDYEVFDSLEDLGEACDLIICVVPPESIPSVGMAAIKTGKKVLLETPLVSTTMDMEAFNSLTPEEFDRVGVAENWPFLPMECFKREVIKSGLIGDVQVVENDYRTFMYHGIAQLKSYLKNKDKVTKIQSVSKQFPLDNGKMDPWFIRTVEFEDDTLMIFKYSDQYKRVSFRLPMSLRIFGSKGTISSDCLYDTDCKIIYENDEGVSEQLEVSIADGTISAGDISWTSPVKGLDEHQISIYQHVDSLIGGTPLYPVYEALMDMVILHSADR